MAGVIVWFDQNWFALLQSVGIVSGLFCTALSIHHDTKARRTSDLLAMAEQHRELWAEIHRSPELRRVLKREVDLLSAPITAAEEEFLNVVFVHFYTGWLIASGGALLPVEAMAADIRSFFSLPIPKSIWQQTRDGRDPKFVQFVDSCLRMGDRT